MIRIVDVHRSYDTEAGAVHALSGVDLDLPSGSITALFGASGSGKTTLLNCVGTLDTPTSGSIDVDGLIVSDLRGETAVEWRRQHLGFVYQAHNLLSWLSARQNVEIALRLHGLPSDERRERALAALDSVGLADRADHLPGELSGGQLQRVSIARALVGEPPVLLADEPTGALDEQTGQRILDLLATHAATSGCTVLIATHDDTVATIADHRVDLRDGRLL